MKGKLKESFPTSENEAITDGTEVEIVDGWCGCDGYYFQCELPGGRQIIINSVNIEITDHRPYIDWDQRRYEISKDVLSAYLSNSNEMIFEGNPEDHAKDAVEFADALIKKLREHN